MKQSSWFSRQHKSTLIFLSVFIVTVVAATVWLIQKVNKADQRIIRLNFIALLLGLVFEYRRIAGKWLIVFWTAIAAYLFSFFVFIPGKTERVYVFEEHLEMWPYCFLGIFVLIAMALQLGSITKKITEGVTLLLTIAINYWIIANGYWDTAPLFIRVLITGNFLISLLSVYNALTYSNLTKAVRLILSVWCSVITLILAVDNFLKLYKYRNIENLPSFSDGALVFLEFFLLGVSSIYIAQNLTLVTAYLPGKRYMETVRETNDIHLGRFSEEQVYVADSIIVLLISMAGFSLNYFYQLLPINLMIWGMVTITPLLLYAIHKMLR